MREGRGRDDVAGCGDPVEDALVACGGEPIAVGHQHERERAAGRLPAGLVWFPSGREMDDGVQCPVAMWVGEVADDRADGEARPPVITGGRRQPS